ncbi:hypothetical protein D3C81_2025010 [compost metagenome]
MQLDDPLRHLVQEVTVMGNEQQRAVVFDQSGLQHFLAEQIQMVGRFVQDQHVGLLQHQLRQGNPGFLSAA